MILEHHRDGVPRASGQVDILGARDLVQVGKAVYRRAAAAARDLKRVAAKEAVRKDAAVEPAQNQSVAAAEIEVDHEIGVAVAKRPQIEDEGVAARPSGKRVVARAAFEHVTPAAPLQPVRADIAGDAVSARAADGVLDQRAPIPLVQEGVEDVAAGLNAAAERGALRAPRRRDRQSRRV